MSKVSESKDPLYRLTVDESLRRLIDKGCLRDEIRSALLRNTERPTFLSAIEQLALLSFERLHPDSRRIAASYYFADYFRERIIDTINYNPSLTETESINYYTLGTKLRDFREASGQTQSQLGRLLGISSSTVSRIETGALTSGGLGSSFNQKLSDLLNMDQTVIDYQLRNLEARKAGSSNTTHLHESKTNFYTDVQLSLEQAEFIRLLRKVDPNDAPKILMKIVRLSEDMSPISFN